MNFDDLVKDISSVCPDFNNSALRDHVEASINSSPDFPALVFTEGFKYVNPDLKFVSYHILTPEEQVQFELQSSPSKSNRAKIPLTDSHVRLVRYNIRFGENHVAVHLYTPYMFENMMHIGGKSQVVRKMILEKTFSRVSEKTKDGITVSPIRVNIGFNRPSTFLITSYVTGLNYSHFVVAAHMFHGNKKGKRICNVTVLHYMLAKFGFVETLRRFGIKRNDIAFVPAIGHDTDQFDYFDAKSHSRRQGFEPELFLKVNKLLLGEDQTCKFVVNILYILSFFDLQNIDNVYVEDGFHSHLSVWKIILGILHFDDRLEPKAHSNAVTHLKSVDHFIDPITQRRFRNYGVVIDDIYDLLVYIFVNIDEFMTKTLSQDIYQMRIDVVNGILVESFATKIFNSLYYLSNKSNLTFNDVKSQLRYNPMMFRQTKRTKTDDSKEYSAPPEIIGDNFLFAGGLNKIRLGGRAEQRLHPSMVVAESINAFVGKYIGKTGYLNPYVPTDADGAILHPDYAEEIDAIEHILPR